jgi:hypothetical protein
MSFLILLALCFPAFNSAKAEDVLPEAVRAELKKPLVPVGSGIYRKFGFSVYKVTFWTTDGVWDRKKPYALEMRYERDVSKDALVDAVTDDLRDQQVANADTINHWHQVLADILPDVEDGDTIVTLCLPGKESPLFHNEKEIARIGDNDFIQAFFDIWLGRRADEDLRNKLLGMNSAEDK